RTELGRVLQLAIDDARAFLQSRQASTLRIPKDVEDLIGLCQLYRMAALEHEYRCRRLTEYILHVHSTHLAHVSPALLPAMPAEIAWYVAVAREGAAPPL
ncbi:hypothetical protein C8Q76DRAFT_629974, partial [Earliella scabrosa]